MNDKQPRLPRLLQHTNGRNARATLYWVSSISAAINLAVLIFIIAAPVGAVPWMIGYCSLAFTMSVWGVMIARDR